MRVRVDERRGEGGRGSTAVSGESGSGVRSDGTGGGRIAGGRHRLERVRPQLNCGAAAVCGPSHLLRPVHAVSQELIGKGCGIERRRGASAALFPSKVGQSLAA